LNASRNELRLCSVSERALIFALPTLASFAHDGIKPHRLTDVLRLAATTLERSPTALGADYRRRKAKLGGAAGVTATAHKLARILYALLTQSKAYARQGLEDYERKHRDRKLKHWQSTADALGFQLVEIQKVAITVS